VTAFGFRCFRLLLRVGYLLSKSSGDLWLAAAVHRQLKLLAARMDQHV
jgi:hypothetical protein